MAIKKNEKSQDLMELQHHKPGLKKRTCPVLLFPSFQITLTLLEASKVSNYESMKVVTSCLILQENLCFLSGHYVKMYSLRQFRFRKYIQKNKDSKHNYLFTVNSKFKPGVCSLQHLKFYFTL